MRHVVTHPRLFGYFVQNHAQNFGCLVLRGLVQTVVNPFPFAPRRHKSLFPQIREVPRNFRLADAQNFGQVADAHLAPVHQIQQAQARLVAKRPKDFVQHMQARAGVKRHAFFAPPLSFLFHARDFSIYIFALTYMSAGRMLS